MSNKINKFLLFLMVFSLLMIIPACFAQNNDTLTLNEQSDDINSSLSISLNDDVISSSNDYYFNSSADVDGNGSRENPYKYLTDSRILNDSTIHLAKGEYDFNPENVHANVSIYGDGSIIKGEGFPLLMSGSFSLNDLTLVNIQILSEANLTAFNVIFTNSTGISFDEYDNSFGGAIYSIGSNSHINIDNCTFENTCAEYGGAIYSEGGIVDIVNSNFYNCYSYNFGGAIVCENTRNVEISKSKFDKCYSINDAGGAIYIMSSRFLGRILEITNSNATFGGAITTLSTDVYLNDIFCYNDSAKWNGGAVYHMYGNFTLTNSLFDSNSASNGGALYIDSSHYLKVDYNDFIVNTASECGGAIYSILNDIQSLNNTYFGNTAKQMNDEYIASEISLTINGSNYTLFKVNPVEIDTLPERYNLAEEGYVTIAKNQEFGGNCWAFTGIAVLESCILKASNIAYDLSEENMKNIAALYSDYGWVGKPNSGGSLYLVSGYLLSWLGAVNDSDDLYDDYSALSPVLDSIVHVQNMVYLYRDSYTDNDAIKQAILKYGAVGSNMAMCWEYYNQNTNSYYCYQDFPINHSVTIVGWDDHYSRYNFNTIPEGDGAWIVRNSWGSNWGEKGIFYISYYDKVFSKPKRMESMYTFILNDTIRYDKNYQYDIAKTDYFLNSTSSVLYKNVFTAGDDEFLAAVSTYFQKITNWTVTVNVNGEFKHSKSGISDNGYYTIDLDQLIPLKRGDVFEVVFSISVDGEAGFPISEVTNNFNHVFYSPGISYASWDGKNWVDLFDFQFEYSYHKYASQVACIKAFTVLNPIETSISLNITYNQFNPANITATVVDQYGNLLKCGEVVFNLAGEEVGANVSNGIASILHYFKKNSNNVSATFKAAGYDSSTAECEFNITKTKIDLNLNVSRTLNNVTLNLFSHDNVNVTAIVHVNGRQHEMELINGKTRLDLENLSNDVYVINVTLPSDSIYESDALVDSIVVDVKRTSILVKDIVITDEDRITYTVTLFDELGNPLSNKSVEFVLDGFIYNESVTDLNGSAAIPISLDAGNYSLTVNFNGDNDYFKSTSKAIIKVKKVINIVLGCNISLNDVVLEIDSSDIIGVPVNVAVNDKNYPVNITDYKNYLYLNNVSNGNYEAIVSLDDNQNYYLDNISYGFVVDARNVEIISFDLVSYTSGVSYNITLLDNQSNPVADGVVTFNVDGKEVSLSVTNGEVSVHFNLAIGEFDVNITYEANDRYYGANANNSITVKSSIVAQDSLTKTFNSQYGVKFLNETGSPLKNSPVTFILNGAEYNKITDDKGYAYADIKLKPGSYSLSIISNWNNETLDKTLKVVSRIANNKNLVIYEYSNKAYKIRIFDNNGKPVGANEKVTIKIAGKSHTAKTNSKGYAIFKINLKNKVYTIKATYKGFTVSNKITVKSKLITSNKVFKKAKSYKYKAKLLNNNGKIVKNKKITFKIKGKKFTAKTNSKGMAKINIRLKLAVGSYKISTSYGRCKETNVIKIKK